MLIKTDTLTHEEYKRLIDTLEDSIEKVNMHYQSLRNKKLEPDQVEYKNHLEGLINSLVKTLHDL